MNSHTPESIEAESALLRAELLATGAELRHHADPAVLIDAAKDNLRRRTAAAPTFLKKNISPIGWLIAGSAVGATITGVAASGKSPAAAVSAAAIPEEATPPGRAPAPTPGFAAKATAAAIAALGLGLGFVGSSFVPKTEAEEQLLSEPKAIVRERVDLFLNQHARGLNSAAWGMFGASRLSAAMLIGLALVAEAVKQPPRPTPRAP